MSLFSLLCLHFCHNEEGLPHSQVKKQLVHVYFFCIISFFTNVNFWCIQHLSWCKEWIQFYFFTEDYPVLLTIYFKYLVFSSIDLRWCLYTHIKFPCPILSIRIFLLLFQGQSISSPTPVLFNYRGIKNFKYLVQVKSESVSCSVVSDCLQPQMTVAHQARLPMGFSRQVYCCGLPGPTPGDLRDQTHVYCIAGRFFTVWATREVQVQPFISILHQNFPGYSCLYVL